MALVRWLGYALFGYGVALLAAGIAVGGNVRALLGGLIVGGGAALLASTDEESC